MGNGHPWDTKKLRRLRRKQRRRLRALPSRVMAGLHAPRPAITLEDANVHAALRAFATLAVMADRLTDDDYLDPRVR